MSFESSTPVSSSACSGCSHLDRRTFLHTASLLSVGAALAACGDGVFDGPAAVADILRNPIRLELEMYPALRQLGGRVVLTPAGLAPMIVETTGTRQYRAFSLVCPHRGTILGVGDREFVCPNHGARFARDGAWIGGQDTSDMTPISVAYGADDSILVGGVVLPPIPPALALSINTVSFTAAIGGVISPAQSVPITNTGGGTVSGVAVTLAYAASQPTGWLVANLSSITAPATLTLSVTGGTLAVGTYAATVQVSATGVSNAAQTVAVTLVVTDATSPPALQLSSAALSFATGAGASPAAQSIQVLNSGSGTFGAVAVAISYGTGATGWLSTTSLSGTTAPATLTVRPLTAALSVGTYSATIHVSGAGVTTRTLTVALTVAASGLAVTISAWPTLASIGGVAGTVGIIDFNGVAVVRTGDNSFAAFSLRCPHEGYLVGVLNGLSFRCPRHGALFTSDGVLQSNSPQRTGNLSRLTVVYVPGDGVLYVS